MVYNRQLKKDVAKYFKPDFYISWFTAWNQECGGQYNFRLFDMVFFEPKLSKPLSNYMIRISACAIFKRMLMLYIANVKI